MAVYNKKIGKTNSQTTKNIDQIVEQIIILDASVVTGLPPTNTWYVNKNGNDLTGEGTASNTYATISKAISVAADNDTIIIYPGSYSESLVINKPLQFLNWHIGSNYTNTPVQVLDIFIGVGATNVSFKGINTTSVSNSVDIDYASTVVNTISFYESAIPILNVGTDPGAHCYLNLIESSITTLNVTKGAPSISTISGNITTFNGSANAGTVTFDKTDLDTLNLDGYSGSINQSHINTLEAFSGSFTTIQTGIVTDNHTGTGSGTLITSNPWGASSAELKTWYVSETGDASLGDGTPGNPYTTVLAAMNEASTNDTIIIDPGYYPESLTIRKSLNFVSKAQHSSLAYQASKAHVNFNTILHPARFVNFDGLDLTTSSNVSVFYDFNADVSTYNAISFKNCNIPQLFIDGYSESEEVHVMLDNCIWNNIVQGFAAADNCHLKIRGGNGNGVTGYGWTGTMDFDNTDITTVSPGANTYNARLCHINTLQNATASGSLYQTSVRFKNNITGNLFDRNVWAGSDDITRLDNYDAIQDASIAGGGGSPSTDTWYVNVDNGSDINNGAPSSPFGSIQHAINTADDGDTIYIAPGDYTIESIQLHKTLNLVSPILIPTLEYNQSTIIPRIGRIDVSSGSPTFTGLRVGILNIGSSSSEFLESVVGNCFIDAMTVNGTPGTGGGELITIHNSAMGQFKGESTNSATVYIFNHMTIQTTGGFVCWIPGSGFTTYVYHAEIDTLPPVGSGSTLNLHQTSVRTEFPPHVGTLNRMNEWLAPTSTKASNAAGYPGQTAMDDDYFYICTADASWGRVAIEKGY